MNYFLTEEGKQYLIREYSDNKRSTYDIAKEKNVYANIIRKALIHHNIKIRTRNEAQAAALSSGRHTHPTKGKKRNNEDILKISKGMAKSWQNMSDDVRKGRVETAKAQWDLMSLEEKTELLKLAGKGIRKAAKEGSQLERFIFSGIKVAGFECYMQAECYIDEEAMHIDILLPANKIAIEVDGPSHYLPIWGEERLQSTIKSDTKKNGLLINAGYTVIRVKSLKKTISKYQKNYFLEQVLKTINNINKNSEKLIYIEGEK